MYHRYGDGRGSWISTLTTSMLASFCFPSSMWDRSEPKPTASFVLRVLATSALTPFGVVTRDFLRAHASQTRPSETALEMPVPVANPIRLASGGESGDADAQWSMFWCCCGLR